MPLSLRRASLPVIFRSGHAARTNLIVSVTDAAGHTGLGEGCPSDMGRANAFLDTHADALVRLDTLDALRGWVAANASVIDAAPAAFCAVELALLDLFARRERVPVETLLDIPLSAVPPRASALYRPAGYMAFQIQALRHRFNGLRSSALTLLGERSRDARRARRLGPRDCVRLDARNLWLNASAANSGLMTVRDHAWAVEEPVKPRDWSAMEEVKRVSGLSIIVSDSLGTLADLDAMPEGRDFIPSLGVSKQGGLLRSLALVARAREQSRAIIIVAEKGETSLLARAGLTLAYAANGALLTTEIGYAPHELTEDTTTPSLRFSRDGVIDVSVFEGRAGWGLDPSPSLAALLTRTPSAA